MDLPSPLEPGTSLGGHYFVGSLINRGGYGAVYRGTDMSEGQRPCAIKETYDVTPASRRQSLMEAAILFTVRNKHLPEVYDAFELNGRFYLVMQLIEGQNFLQLARARKRPFEEQEVIQWMTPIIRVLQELHSRTPPVIHRDIKPGNIILTPEGVAVLVDFGITKLLEPGTNTQTIARAASEGFSPLEQYVGQTNVRSDLYALAATMYFLLTLRTPPAAIERSFHDELVPPRDLNLTISPRLERILLKAMAVKPDDRYPDLRAFLDDLLGHTQSDPFQSQGLPSRNASALFLPSDAPDSSLTGGAHARPTSHASSGRHTPIRSANSGSQQQQAHSYYPSLPASSGPNIPPPATPYTQPSYNPGNRSASPPLQPSTHREASRGPLPGTWNQGCLWGLLQGIISALLIVVAPLAGKLTLAILLGLVIYGLAGFATTRKGGSAVRGIWTGLWAGIISVIVFWIAALILGVLYRTAPGFSSMIKADLSLIQHLPVFQPKQTGSLSSESNRILTVLSFYYIEGVFVAMLCGWIGGILGRMQYMRQLNNS